jgi:transposase
VSIFIGGDGFLALKIVFPCCCGIDVHKNFLVACIATTDNKGVTTYLSKRFSTFTNALRKLADWLAGNDCRDVCMESTGKYWIPVFNVLEQSCKVILAHPKYVKSIRGQKTDKKDAQWIADIFKHNLVSPSFIPPFDIRQLRDLSRYSVKLTGFITGEKNRAQNCLTVSNIQIDHVFSDVFGKSAGAITEQFLEHPDGNFDVAPFVDSRVKAPLPEIQSAIDGSLCFQQAEKLRLIRQHLNALDACKTSLKALIEQCSSPFNSQIELVMTVPGIQRPSAVSILSEIGVDMSVFPTAKHLCSWAGLTPQNDQSAGKKKTTRISRAGTYIKPLLVQCSLAAIASKKHPEIKRRYTALKKRRGHKKAIIAICRMLLTAIYAILKKAEPYDPSRYRAFDTAPVNRSITTAQAVLLARRLGYFVVKAQVS